MARVEIKINDVDTATREVETSYSMTKKELEALVTADAENVIASHMYSVYVNNSFKNTARIMGSGQFERFIRLNSPKANVRIIISDKDDGSVNVTCDPSRFEMSSMLKRKGISPAMVYALEALEYLVQVSKDSTKFSIVQ